MRVAQRNLEVSSVTSPGELRERHAARTLVSLAGYALVFGALAHRWLAAATHSGPLHDVTRGAHPSDAHFHTWILAWVYRALTTDPAKLFEAPIYFPAPRQLTGAENFLSSQVLFAPVLSLTGNPVLAMNALCFLAYPVAAVAMEGLLLSLGLSGVVAWTTGLIYALGPLHVPASYYGPNLVHAYPPLVALALVELRRRPGAARAGLFAIVLSLGLFSSLYMASMVGAAAGVWLTLEASRAGEGRARFLALSTVVTAIALLLMVAFLRPYRERAWESSVARAAVATESAGVRAAPAPSSAPSLAASLQAARPLLWAGGGQVGLTLAAARLLAIVSAGVTRTTVAGLSMLALGSGSALVVLLNGGMPTALIGILGFFRWIGRTQILTSFGISLLAAESLETCRSRLPRSLSFALFLVVIGTELATDGSRLVTPTLDRIALPERDVASYVEIGKIASEQGGGPLLELPETDRDGRDLRPDSMLAALLHGHPLVNGFTGYLPPHFLALNFRIHELPEPKALGQLADLTGLRWVLLRPASHWKSMEERRRFEASFAAMRDTRRFDVDGFTLFGIDHASEHPSWAAAVASGRGIGDLPLEDRLRLEPWKVQGLLGRRTPTRQLEAWIAVIRHASGALDEATQRQIFDLAHAAARARVCPDHADGFDPAGNPLDRFDTPSPSTLATAALGKRERRLRTTYRIAVNLFLADARRRKQAFCDEADRHDARDIERRA